MENREQIEYWNGAAGQNWVSAQDRLDDLLEALSNQAIAAANPGERERVLDVGCGCGATTLALAASGAQVTGIDISAPMLVRAIQRAGEDPLVTFLEADASTHTFDIQYDLLFSRFGVMFFDDPYRAFQNLRHSLNGDGRLVFMCWQAPANNPWVSLAGRALAPFLPDTPDADPRAPGPFAFADPNYIEDLLQQAEFGEINIQSIEVGLHLGNTLESAMAFQGEIGPLSRALSELSGEAKRAALRAVETVFAERMTDAGLVLGGATWLVSAQAC